MKASELVRMGRDRLVRARKALSRTGDEQEQAMELLEAALGYGPDPDETIPPRARAKFESFIERRAAGEPIPYIVGSIDFLGLRLLVEPGAFVPRYTTEFLAEEAIRRIKRRSRPTVVDVACGVGPVALAAAHAVPSATVYGVDIWKPAVAQARRNARVNKLRNVRFLESDLFSALPRAIAGTVDVVTSHPPYVPKGEVRTLPDELRAHEPAVSLTDGSSDGLGLARAVIAGARDWLAPNGWLLIEIGSSSARPLRTEIVRAGYTDVASLMTPLKYTRVVVGRRGR